LKGQADHVVNIAYELSLSANPPTIQELRRRFGSELRQPDPCAADGCGYDLFVSNRPLAAARLVPYAALRSYFWVKNGVVYENRLEFWTVTKQGPMVLSYVVVKYCEDCNSFEINPWKDSSYWGTTGSVEIGYAASTENKRKAIALNTDCLARARGCTNIAEMFPGLWRQTPDGVISCRLPNTEGVVSKSAQPQSVH
jgi:hypothetical protein